MDEDEPFVLNEVDYKTPKQSPHTWPMDKIRQTRFPQNMSSLLSPVTPKRNYSISSAKSLLLQCLRDSKSDPVPIRRFPAACSDEGVLMDGVLVTSASGKKVSDSLGRSARSSVIKSLQKNSEFISPRSKSAHTQETRRSQQFSGGKENMLANSPFETPKPANPSKLKASAKPFILTPKSSPRIASPVPLLRVPYGHDPHLPWGSPCPQMPLSYAHRRPLHGPQLQYLPPPASPLGTNLFLPHYLARSPVPTGNKMPHDFNQSPATKDPITSPPTTPFSVHKPPVHTPTSTKPEANLSTSTSSHGSSLNLPTSLDELDIVTLKLDLSPPSDGLEAETKQLDLSCLAGLQTMTTKSDWSPSDDGLPTFTQAQTDYLKSHNRILPDDVFEHYKYGERLQIFTQLWLNDKA